MEYENTFEAVSSEQELIDRFLEGYGTNKNWLRVYGGFVETQEPSFDKKGLLTFSFSRPVVFPTKLIAEYNSDYEEVVPKLTPTEDELKEIS